MKKATLGRGWVLQTNLEIINSGGTELIIQKHLHPSELI